MDESSLSVHLDVMHMHSSETYYDSSAVVKRAFDLLADDAANVHAKDIRWDPEYRGMKVEEAMPGRGDVDFDRFIQRVDELSVDTPVVTEYWEYRDGETRDLYAEAVRHLRPIADRKDVRPITRTRW